MARGKKKETLTPEDRLQAALVPESEQPYKVPGNWCWVSLQTIDQYRASSTDPSKYPDTLFELYSVPSRTGVNITPETCLELSKIPNIVAIKEASGNISQIAEIADLCGDDLNIYSGNDDQIVPILSIGGLGVISVLSNVAPKFTHEMVQDFFDGNVEESKNKQLKSLKLTKALFSEVNPIPVKAALNMLGYDYGIPRLPLVEMSENKKKVLEEELKNFGLI